MTVLKSLKSRGHVDETFTWRHAYYRLNNTGITYLRETLHLPAEIVPATLKKQATAAPAGPAGRRPDMRQGGRGGERGGDRGDYRRGPAGDKTADAGAGAAPMEFRSWRRPWRLQERPCRRQDRRCWSWRCPYGIQRHGPWKKTRTPIKKNETVNLFS